LMVKTMVSCKFSLKPIHWNMLQDLMPHFLATDAPWPPWSCDSPGGFCLHGPLLNCELLQSNSENAMWSMTSCN
jgi:hypothetical protein